MENYTAEVMLPSRALLYDGIDEVVSIRMLRVEDEQLFASMVGNTRVTSVINKLISSCVQFSAPIEPKKLLVDDRFFLLFKIRSFTYTPEYRIDMTCIRCDKKFTHVYNIDEAEVIYLQEDNKEILLTLPISKDVLVLRRATGEDEEAVISYEKNFELTQRKTVTSDDVKIDPSYIFRIACMIDKVNGQEIKRKDAIAYVKAMYGRDSLAIRQCLEKSQIGLKPTENVECPYCSADNLMLLSLNLEFFRPTLPQ